MSEKIITHIYKLKRGSEQALNKNNQILQIGEPVVVYCNDGVTRLKIGDGVKHYKELPYAIMDDTQLKGYIEYYITQNNSTMIEDMKSYLSEVLHPTESKLTQIEDNIDTLTDEIKSIDTSSTDVKEDLQTLHIQVDSKNDKIGDWDEANGVFRIDSNLHFINTAIFTSGCKLMHMGTTYSSVTNKEYVDTEINKVKESIGDINNAIGDINSILAYIVDGGTSE